MREAQKSVRFTYDERVDAAYIYLVDEIGPGGVAKTYVCDSADVGGMINLDFDAEGRLIGIELLDGSKLLSKELFSAVKQNS